MPHYFQVVSDHPDETRILPATPLLQLRQLLLLGRKEKIGERKEKRRERERKEEENKDKERRKRKEKK